MKLSARNVLPGKVVDVKRGATTSHIRIDIGGGAIVTASITASCSSHRRIDRGSDHSTVSLISAYVWCRSVVPG